MCKQSNYSGEVVSNSVNALDNALYAYGEELERVEVFKCLGCLVAFDDDDTQAVWGILRRHVATGQGFPAFCG